jgi:hypothetical protein
VKAGGLAPPAFVVPSTPIDPAIATPNSATSADLGAQVREIIDRDLRHGA